MTRTLMETLAEDGNGDGHRMTKAIARLLHPMNNAGKELLLLVLMTGTSYNLALWWRGVLM